jgi:hypothetical protein
MEDLCANARVIGPTSYVDDFVLGGAVPKVTGAPRVEGDIRMQQRREAFGAADPFQHT